ncbi:hypothetical protein LCGC14_2635480, partial [marine sediment metagenome]
AYEICPKFEYYYCNKCPLHKDFAKLQNAPVDITRKCRCPKGIRKEIGVYFKLKNMGLNRLELNGVRLSIQINKQLPFNKAKNLKMAQNRPQNTSNPRYNKKILKGDEK